MKEEALYGHTAKHLAQRGCLCIELCKFCGQRRQLSGRAALLESGVAAGQLLLGQALALRHLV